MNFSIQNPRILFGAFLALMGSWLIGSKGTELLDKYVGLSPELLFVFGIILLISGVIKLK